VVLIVESESGGLEAPNRFERHFIGVKPKVYPLSGLENEK
jgi:hypothetical protein